MNLPFPRFSRHWLAFSHDSAVAALAYLLALYLRIGDDIVTFPTAQILSGTGLFTLTCAVVFLFSGLYRGIWAFASVRDLIQMRGTRTTRPRLER